MEVPPPEKPHCILNRSITDSRVIIVGDIHGCLVEFLLILLKCSYNIPELIFKDVESLLSEEDKAIVNQFSNNNNNNNNNNISIYNDADDTDILIILGDLVNKGPYSYAVVRFIRKLQRCKSSDSVFCIRGNHDDAALFHSLSSAKAARPESYSYVDNFESDDIEWLKQLPYTLYLDSINCLFVHAGLVPNIQLVDQNHKDLCTMRNVITNESRNNLNNEKTLIGTNRIDEGLPWASVYSDSEVEVPHVFFGHDARRNLQIYRYATGLDTGCCYGRQLSAMILPERRLVQVDALKMYSEPKDKD